MAERSGGTYTAFVGRTRIASGELADVAGQAKAVLDGPDALTVFIFEDATGRQVDLDFRGTVVDVRRRLAAAQTEEDQPTVVGAAPALAVGSAAVHPTGGAAGGVPTARPRGRPRLGVVAREVTLLPRHWEWLATQPGGASVALRRLVEEARRAGAGRDRQRIAREAAYRWMTAMAGDEPGYEEAVRALFADDAARFHALVERWPGDLGDHARRMAAAAF